MAVGFRILGPLEVVVDGEARPLPEGRESDLLLALLLVAGERVTQQDLLAAVWGPDAPITNLHAGVSRLRRRLTQLGVDGAIVQTAPGGYRIAVEPDRVDLVRFRALVRDERYEEALALWRGTGPAALAEERLTATEAFFAARLDAGEGPELVPELQALVTAHPFRERPASLLMVALTRAGRQVEALEVYRRLRERLDEELGLDPGLELRELEVKVLRQDPELFVRAPATAVTHPGRRRRALVAVVAAVAVVVAVAVADGGGTAVAVRGTGAVLVDASSLERLATVTGGRAPAAMAVGAGAVWLADGADRTLARIDPQRHTAVDMVGLAGAASDLATTGDGLLVSLLAPHRAVRVDGRLVDIAAQAALPGGGGGPAPLAVRGNDLWIARLNGPVLRLDATTLRLRRRFPIHGDGGQPAVTATAAWIPVANPGGVVRIDLRSGAERTVDLPGVPSAVASDGTSVWVAQRAPDRLLKLDPQTGRQLTSVQLKAAPGRLATGLGAVWVLEPSARRLERVAGRRVTGSVRFVSSPEDVAVGAGGVWLALRQRVG